MEILESSGEMAGGEALPVRSSLMSFPILTHLYARYSGLVAFHSLWNYCNNKALTALN